MKELVIDRSKWVRKGKGAEAFANEEVSLLNGEGHMCCLGFYMRACGLPKNRIEDVSLPSDLVTSGASLPKRAAWLLEMIDKNSSDDIEQRLVNTNDDKDMAAREKERRIAKLFRAYGDVRVRFVGRTPRRSSPKGGAER